MFCEGNPHKGSAVQKAFKFHEIIMFLDVINSSMKSWKFQLVIRCKIISLISMVHGANMEPIWGRQDPGGPHVGPMNLAIRDVVTKHNIYPSKMPVSSYFQHNFNTDCASTSHKCVPFNPGVNCMIWFCGDLPYGVWLIRIPSVECQLSWLVVLLTTTHITSKTELCWM